MTLPAVNITELDGALGVLPASSGRLLALVGVASAAAALAVNTPATFAKVKDLTTALVRGPLLEAAAHMIEKYGKPVLVVRSGASVAGSYLNAVAPVAGSISAIAKTGGGSSVFTDNASAPTVGAQVVVLFNVGGTRGVAGIVYQISLDNGQTWGAPQALGTAVNFAVGATGASIAVGAGTINAGDFISFTLTAPVAGSAGQLVTSLLGGTSVPTIDGATAPADDYEVVIQFVKGGTRGVAGITYKWSLDGGRTMSAETALGTATNIVIPDSGGVKVDFGAGTIIAGATIAFPTVAPRWNNTELGQGLDALGVSQVNWAGIEVVGTIDADAFDLLETKVPGMAARGKRRWWIGNTRMPVGAESEATYLASLSGVFGSKATKHGALCAGAQEMVSSVSGRKYRRPVSFAAAALEASVAPEVNTGDVNVGLLPVSIRDANGNPKHHDEAANPGLDDARFYVLRTHEGRQGVYPNVPRLFSPAGSDFELLAHRRVMNVIEDALAAYFLLRLQKPIRVKKTTGLILEEEALEIEAGANAAVEAVAGSMVSGHEFVLSRFDNLLSTKTLTGDERAVPLAYPQFINLAVGYKNPALQVQAV